MSGTGRLSVAVLIRIGDAGGMRRLAASGRRRRALFIRLPLRSRRSPDAGSHPVSRIMGVGRVPAFRRGSRWLGGGALRAPRSSRRGTSRRTAPCSRSPRQNEQELFVGGTVGIDGTGSALREPRRSPEPRVWGLGAEAPMACEGWDDSDPSRAGIYTVRASDGPDLQRLTRERDIPCDYSPDGTELAFIRTGANPHSGH